MAAYATLQQAKDQVRITASDQDTQVQRALDAAEAIVLDYLKTPQPGNARIVQQAVLIQFAELWKFRGDDQQGPEQTDGHLSPVVTNLLRRLRDPALA